jgi:tRNA-2-methylthio-N6-dimethylallyladenosine synthase
VYGLAVLPGLARIRYMTSHPNDMTEGLIRAHADVPKLMPFLHLPVQSGSDRILKAMNRSHDSASYLRVIERVRTARPDIAISGDFIVGFPGESDAEFEETLSIVRHAQYAQAYSFKFSARPGTPAATMDGQIEPEMMDERLQRLQALINEQQLAFNQASIGQRTDILLERKGRHPGQLIGKTPWLQSVHVQAEGAAIGDLIAVDLISAGPNSIAGEIVLRQAQDDRELHNAA